MSKIYVTLLTLIEDEANHGSVAKMKEHIDWEGELEWTGQQPHIIVYEHKGYVQAYSRHIDEPGHTAGKVVHFYRERSAVILP